MEYIAPYCRLAPKSYNAAELVAVAQLTRGADVWIFLTQENSSRFISLADFQL